MEIARLLCTRTAVLAKDAAVLLRVPVRTLQNWWEKIPTPPHRKGVQGALPDDPVKALEARVQELEAALAERNAMIEEKTGEDPKDTGALIDLARLRLQEMLGGGCAFVKMGELAAALRVLVDVREKEIDAAVQDRVKVVYYMPGGVCPACGGQAPKIRPEDLFDQADLSRPN
jgi:hypothetical protein